MLPVMLSIAGSDCSAGAGLQADLKSAHAMGAYALTAVTCVVSEVPGKVNAVSPISSEIVADQTRLCLDTFPVGAVKTGMLYSPEIVRAVADELKGRSLPLVVDPVMIATAGDPLMLESAISVYEETLLPLATLLTPNMDELEKLAGFPIGGEEDLLRGAMVLAQRYGIAILAKGGHMPHECCDMLVFPNGRNLIRRRPKITGVSTHGTGCTLSSAIAARLAAGDDLESAVDRALAYVASAIASSLRWETSSANPEILNHGTKS